MWNLNPFNHPRILQYSNPTPEQILRKQLDEAARERVHAAAKIEEWESHHEMLCKRIHRILNELKEIEGK